MKVSVSHHLLDTNSCCPNWYKHEQPNSYKQSTNISYLVRMTQSFSNLARICFCSTLSSMCIPHMHCPPELRLHQVAKQAEYVWLHYLSTNPYRHISSHFVILDQMSWEGSKHCARCCLVELCMFLYLQLALAIFSESLQEFYSLVANQTQAMNRYHCKILRHFYIEMLGNSSVWWIFSTKFIIRLA